MSLTAALGRPRFADAILQALQGLFRPPSIGQLSPMLGQLARSVPSQTQPAMQSLRQLRTLAAWRPVAPLGCTSYLRSAWPAVGTQSQLELCRGLKGTTNAKKKKKAKKKAKIMAYRAEAQAIAAAECEDRQMALLARTPPRQLAALQQQRAFSAAQRRPQRPDLRLRAVPVAALEADAAAAAPPARCAAPARGPA